jgi:hypothetical protein
MEDHDMQTPEQAAAEWASVALERETGVAPAATTPEIPPSDQVPEAETPAEKAPAQEEHPADPYAGLSADVRKKLERFDDLANQVPSLVQGLQEAKGRIGALQSELAKSKQAPTAAQVAAADPEKWAALKKDFPEWGEGIEARIEQRLGSIAGQNLTAEQMSEAIAKAQDDVRKEYQEDLVSIVHANWREDINTDAFGEWFKAQTPETQALSRSTKGLDAIKMLNMFHKAQEKPVVDVKEERKQRLAAAAQAKPGAPAVTKTFEDMSPAEQWNFMAAERDRAAKA